MIVLGILADMISDLTYAGDPETLGAAEALDVVWAPIQSKFIEIAYDVGLVGRARTALQE